MKKVVEIFTSKGFSKGLYEYTLTRAGTIDVKNVGNEKSNYILSQFGKTWRCNCSGYLYHKTCSHVMHCPFKPTIKIKEAKSKDNIFIRAAKRAYYRLPNGKYVNGYEWFWRGNRQTKQLNREEIKR